MKLWHIFRDLILENKSLNLGVQSTLLWLKILLIFSIPFVSVSM